MHVEHADVKLMLVYWPRAVECPPEMLMGMSGCSTGRDGNGHGQCAVRKLLRGPEGLLLRMPGRSTGGDGNGHRHLLQPPGWQTGLWAGRG